MIEIFDRSDLLKTVIEPTDNSTQEKEIQGENVLNISFSHHSYVQLDVDDYIIFQGEKYRLTERYRPQQISDREWRYDIKLYGIESLLGNYLVLKIVDGENEPIFSLTAPPAEHVHLIADCLNRAFPNSPDWSVGHIEGTENITIDYEGKYCDAALKEIADKTDSEVWFEGTTINISLCEKGEPLVIGYDNGLINLDTSHADNVKFYTHLFPIGSSRNIDPEKYGHSRLQLPGGVKWVEINSDKYARVDHYEADAFADIYPRRIGTVSSVRSIQKIGTDGKPFTIYYFKDSDLNFNPNDYELAGLVKRVSFQEGSELAGLGNEDNGTYYFEVNFNNATSEFEIITIFPYSGIQLPGAPLVPKIGDKYILWNIRMPEEYYSLAEQELLDAVDEYNKKHCLDTSIFKAQTDHVWVENTNADLYIGRRVRLVSAHFFPEKGYRESRITKVSRKINLPSCMDIEIGDVLGLTVRQQLSNNIQNVHNFAKSISDNANSISGRLEVISKYINDISNIFVPVNYSLAEVDWNATDIYAVKCRKGFYSEQFISALGLSDTSIGTGSNLFGLMRNWPATDPGVSTTDALGANLGWELRQDVLSLKSGSALSVVTAGSGNAITDIVKFGTTITATRGATFLTQHQSLANYYTKTEVNNKDYIKVIDCFRTTEWSDIRTTDSTLLTMRAFDVYGTEAGGPTTYGNVLEIVGRSGHWQPQLWFDSGKTGNVRHRNKTYNDNTWGDWYILLDTGNYSSILDSRYYTESEINAMLTNGSVTKVGTATVGAANRPIYLNAGTPTACTYSFGNGSGNAALNNGTRNTNLNADMLDGAHADDIRKSVLRFKSITGTSEIGGYDLNTLAPEGGCISNYGSYSYWANAPTGALYGMALHLVAQYNIGGQLFADINHNSSTDVTRTLWWRASGTVNNVKTWGKWHQIAFTDGNVVSATKLQTSRTLWGRPFDGTENVTGALTDVTSITMSGTLNMGVNKITSASDYISLLKGSNAQKFLTGGLLVSDNYSDRDKIPSFGAYIKGNAKVGSLTIGDVTITYDAVNGGLHIIGGGLYSDSYISALGLNSAGSSGGGSVFGLMKVWPATDPGVSTTDALGANLGWGLRQDVSALIGRVSALENGSALTVTTTGAGNAVTAISKSGNIITATKGATFLTYTPLNGGLIPSSATTWGNSTGTQVAEWTDSAGKCAFKFKKDNPSSGKMSMLIDGTVYINEGADAVASQAWVNGRGFLTAHQSLANYYTKSESAAAFMPVQAYHFDKGLLVKLKIAESAYAMVTLTIKGNSYIRTEPPIDTIVQFYNYPINNAILQVSAVHFGYDFGKIKVFCYNGYVYVHFSQQLNYQTFLMTAYHDTTTGNAVGSITNEAMPTAGVTRLVEVTPTKGVRSDNYASILGSVYAPLSHSHSQYALASALANYYTKTESDGKFVKKAGDTMTGALTVPKLYINGGGSTAFLSADNSYSAYINVGGKVLGFWSANEMTFRPSGIYNGQVSLGQSSARWSTVYANSLNVASGAMVTNLNADMLDGVHASELARGGTAFYTANDGTGPRWIRIATFSSDVSSGIITIENTYNRNPNAALIFTFSAGYRGNDRYSLTQIGGTNALFSKARIVYPTATHEAGFIELYYDEHVSGHNQLFVKLTNAINTTLIQTATTGAIPTTHAAYEQSFVDNGIAANNIAAKSITCDGWIHTKEGAGWINDTYGGGWSMIDSTWLRVWGGKSIYQDSGIMRTDGQLQVGNDGERFLVDLAGNATVKSALTVGGNITTTADLYAGYGELDDAEVKYGLKVGMALTVGSATLTWDLANTALKCNQDFYSTKGVSALGVGSTSDMRLKNYVRPLKLSVADIARAPIFIHTWKNPTEYASGEWVGTSAQYWLGVLPQAVKLRQWYEMDYAKAAMASVIVVARQTEDLKSRVERLERENKELRQLLKAS